MILARSTKTNARREECVIEEISAKISLTGAVCSEGGIVLLSAQRRRAFAGSSQASARNAVSGPWTTSTCQEEKF